MNRPPLGHSVQAPIRDHPPITLGNGSEADLSRINSQCPLGGSCRRRGTVGFTASPKMYDKGHKRKWRHDRIMSVLSLKADIRQHEWHVRYVPLADINPRPKRQSKDLRSCLGQLL